MPKNWIETDDLDLYGKTEYLPEETEISRKVSDYLQRAVDEYMDGLAEDSPINLVVTSAVVGEIRSIAVNLRGKGVHVEEPRVREPWRLDGMTEKQWGDEQRAWGTKDAVQAAYWRALVPGYDEE